MLLEWCVVTFRGSDVYVYGPFIDQLTAKQWAEEHFSDPNEYRIKKMDL